MKQLRSHDLRKLLSALEELYALQEIASFPRRILSILRNLIPSDLYYSYTAFNQHGKTMTSLCDPFEAIERVHLHDEHFNANLHEHPLVSHLQKGGREQIIKLSDFLNRVQFHALTLYKEYYKKVGVEFQMVLSFPNPYYRAFIALNRNHHDFTERERVILTIIRPSLIKVYLHLNEISRYMNKLNLLQHVVEGGDGGLILLTPEGAPDILTRKANEWLRGYFPGRRSWKNGLPEDLSGWVNQQRALRNENVRMPFIRNKKGKRLQIYWINGGDQGSILQLTEKDTESVSYDILYRQYRLTHREADVALWMVKGKKSSEIGKFLHLSYRTVEKHIESIYTKLGVENRSSAVASICEVIFKRDK